MQMSFAVQDLPSLHEVPSTTGGFVQVPLASHDPAVWHWSAGAHATAPPQTPAVQTSPVVQDLPSLQVEPSAFAGFVQAPFASHMPAAWHWSVGAQATEPAHVPPVQTSPVVQDLPSLQVVPSAFVGLVQAPFASHAPAAWH
jgi:hypothetical protein